jgi:hypothetical protein
VSKQTVREGKKFGIDAHIVKDDQDIKLGINITNYEKLHKFNPTKFGGVVLDESSILKNQQGKRRNQIINTFESTPFKLCCTATPSPNDFTELGNTAEFLGVRTMPEMLSMFFINDTSNTGEWRLKGHVEKNVFWEWLCSWAVMIQKPSDLGFENLGFNLPKLNYIEHIIPFNGKNTGLFVEAVTTMSERRQVRKESVIERCQYASNIVNQYPDRQWLVWCDLNHEGSELSKRIENSVEIKGSDSDEHKENSMLAFSDGHISRLITKPQIAGHGMNWQNCSDMIFVGLSDSYERLYQAIRRCWRFGQKNEVNVHIVIEEREGAVLENIKRKDRQMQIMFKNMVANMQDIMSREILKTSNKKEKYNPTIEMELPKFVRVA